MDGFTHTRFAQENGVTVQQRQAFTQADNVPPLVVRPMQACALLSIGLTRCYELMNAGELQSFKDGKSRKITVSSINAYIDRRMGAHQ
jgi:excisionase family DNA binding protein